MKRNWNRTLPFCSTAGLLAGGLVAACSASPADPVGPVTLSESAAALRAVRAVQRQFVVPSAGRAFGGTDAATVALPSGATASYRIAGGKLAPAEIATRSIRRATAGLGVRADEPFELESRGMKISAKLLGAGAVSGELADGLVVYRGGMGPGGEADVFQRVTESGTEDYVSFAERPRAARLSYEVDLGAGVAGLRLVGNTLEMLNPAGTPTLRVAPPYGIDAEGKRFAAKLRVTGCAVDLDPRAPWGRPITPPGSRVCTLHVEWEGAKVVYPALIDPAWVATGAMTVPRAQHGMTRVPGDAAGRVLVAGGHSAGVNGGSLDSAELYDPATQSWAATDPMKESRSDAVTFGDGVKVTVCGGDTAGGGLGTGRTSCETWDPALGTWSNLPATKAVHTRAVLDILDDGRAVLVGGNGPTPSCTGVVEIRDPGTKIWSLGAPMPTKLCQGPSHSAVGKSQVLVAQGSLDPYNQPTNLAFVYDADLDTWTPQKSAPVSGLSRSSLRLPDGRHFSVGGVLGAADWTIFDPATGDWTTGPAPFASTNVASANGAVLLGSNVLYMSEGTDAVLLDLVARTFTKLPTSASRAHSPAMVVLADGRPMVCGGIGTASCDILHLCAKDDECPSTAYCELPAGTCELKGATGLALPNGGICAGSVSNRCRSGSCDDDNVCGHANGNGACTSQTATGASGDCRSGICDDTANEGTGLCRQCLPANVAGCGIATPFCDTVAFACVACNGDDGTSATATCPTATPYCPGGGAACATCGTVGGTVTCTAAGAIHAGGTCRTSGACSDSCAIDADCLTTQWCDSRAVLAICAAKLPNSQAIPTNLSHVLPLDGKCTDVAAQAVCQSGVCDVLDDACGYADGSGPCDPKDPSVCRGAACSGAKVCIPLGGCASDGDCGPSSYCNISAFACTPKVASGDPVPTDLKHTSPPLEGKCTPEAGIATCVVGVCDVPDNLCGLADGTACATDDVCRSRACSDTGKVCIPAGGCVLDDDCTITQYCETPNKLCVSKRSNGLSVPTVAGHSPELAGKCTTDAGRTTCASGVCDVKDNLCGLRNGSGPCAVDTPGACRSGFCDATTLLCADPGGTGGAGGSGGAAGQAGAAGQSAGGAGQGGNGVAGTAGTAGTGGTSGGGGSAGTGGASGAAGTAGKSGAAGTAGKSGAAGASGAAGKSGAAGASGAAGKSGAAGASGSAGKSGAAGTGGATPQGGSAGTGTGAAAGKSGAAGATGLGGSSAGAGGRGQAGEAGKSGAGQTPAGGKGGTVSSSEVPVSEIEGGCSVSSVNPPSDKIAVVLGAALLGLAARRRRAKTVASLGRIAPKRHS